MEDEYELEACQLSNSSTYVQCHFQRPRTTLSDLATFNRTFRSAHGTGLHNSLFVLKVPLNTNQPMAWAVCSVSSVRVVCNVGAPYQRVELLDDIFAPDSLC